MSSKNHVWLTETLGVLVLVVSNCGCGGGTSSTHPTPISVSVAAGTTTVQAGATTQVTATVTNDSANRGVTWSVVCSQGLWRDAVWLAKYAINTGTTGPDRTVAAVRNYIAAFLDANLRGRPMDLLMTGPSSDYADTEVTTQERSLCGRRPAQHSTQVTITVQP
jgi:hypothetical protein